MAEHDQPGRVRSIDLLRGLDVLLRPWPGWSCVSAGGCGAAASAWRC